MRRIAIIACIGLFVAFFVGLTIVTLILAGLCC